MHGRAVLYTGRTRKKKGRNTRTVTYLFTKFFTTRSAYAHVEATETDRKDGMRGKALDPEATQRQRRSPYVPNMLDRKYSGD